MPIAKDGVDTGYFTDHGFTDLYGTHTFTVPSTYWLQSVGGSCTFKQWGTGETSTTVTVTTGWNYSARYYAPKVAAPTFSPPGGTYSSHQTVALSCSTSGATIRYTSDGSQPSSLSAAYSSLIEVSSTTTIRAKAFKSGMTSSDTASATYTFAVIPEFSSTTAMMIILATLTMTIVFTEKKIVLSCL